MGPPAFELDGHEFRSAEVGLTDAYTTTVLWLVVVGDTVNGDAHQYFGEANTTEQRTEWLRAPDKIEALGPHTLLEIRCAKRIRKSLSMFNILKKRDDCPSYTSTHRGSVLVVVE
ncbi:hypothetical protein DPV78_004252 [Talaromyces pinophilus]|nr:hypothetical protein DPV78_004252 [Talaromyces pinophilus]